MNATNNDFYLGSPAIDSPELRELILALDWANNALREYPDFTMGQALKEWSLLVSPMLPEWLSLDDLEYMLLTLLDTEYNNARMYDISVCPTKLYIVCMGEFEAVGFSTLDAVLGLIEILSIN